MRFSEQFSLRDLDSHAISRITSEYLYDREHGQNTDNRAKVAAVRFNEDKLYIHYKARPTYDKSNVAFDADSRRHTSDVYDVLFEFQAATDNVGDPQTFLQFNPSERASVIRDYMNNGMARVWCSCGAFTYQGHWEAMSKHDSAVFPYTGPRGKGIWQAKHADGLVQPGISICKHIASCIHHIDNDVPNIANLLASQMKQYAQ